MPARYSKTKIRDLLKDYYPESIEKIPLGSHVRYFIADKDPLSGRYRYDSKRKIRKAFRRGGFIVSKSTHRDETTGTLLGKVILKNEPVHKVGFQWTVSLDEHTVFFRKTTVMMYQKELQRVQKIHERN